jgi:hypothetical protein
MAHKAKNICLLNLYKKGKDPSPNIGSKSFVEMIIQFTLKIL